MKKTARIDALRNIQKRFISWLSMATIVFIGTSMILGLFFTCRSLEDIGFKYVEDHNLKDMDVACTIGIAQQDIDRILQIEGIKDAEGMLSLAGQIGAGEKSAGAYLFSKTDRVSVPYAVEGRLPENADECGISTELAQKLAVSTGDEITIQVASSRLSNTFSDGKFVITGIVGHPDYMSPGKVDFCLFPKNCFNTKEAAFDYTNLLIDLDVPGSISPTSKRFMKESNKVRSEIDAIADELTQRRLESLSEGLEAEYEKAKAEADKQLAEAKEKIDAGQKEYDDKIAKAQKKLSDAENELNEGKAEAEKELAEGAKKIREGEEEYNARIADGERQLAEAEANMEKELNDAKWKLFDGFLEIDKNEKLLNEKEEEYKKAQDSLVKGKTELDEGQIRFEAALNKANEKVNNIITFAKDVLDAEIQQAIEDHDQEMEDYWRRLKDKFTSVENLNAIEKSDALIKIYDDHMSEYNPIVKEVLEEIFPQIGAFRQGVADLKEGKERVEKAIRDYEEGRQRLEEARQQLDQGWYDLKKAKEKLAEGEAEYARKEPEARKQLADAKAEFEQKKADGAKQLEDAKKTYEAKKREAFSQIEKYEKELEEGRREFDDQKAKGEKELKEAREKYEASKKEAEEKFAEAREQIERAKETPCKWFTQTRSANLYFMEFASYCDILAKVCLVFSPIYAVVVIVVCFFTMAIIVEEQAKQTGTCKALGMYKSEIRKKYLLFGATASIFGAFVGIGGALGIERLVCNSISKTFVFGNPPHKYEFVPTLLVITGSALVTCLSVYWSSEKILSCSAVGLISGNEPVNRARKRASRNGNGSVYTRLILNNFVTDIGREIVSVVIIMVCCMLIGLGTTIKLAHAGAMHNQVDNILLYDICLTMSDNITEEEKQIILDAIKDYDYVSTTKIGGVIQTEDGQTLTESFVVDDKESFKRFFAFRDMEGKEVPFKDEGIMASFEMEEKNGLTTGRDVVFFTNNLKMVQGKISGHFMLHAGKMVFLSADSYREALGTEPDHNAFLIKTGGNVAQIRDELSRLKGVSDISKSDDLLEEKAGIMKLYTAIVFIVIGFSILLSFMILLNLSNILVSHRMRELLTMRVNGFSNGQVIGYLVREIMVTTVISLILGLIIGIPVTNITISTLEGNGFMFLRKLYVHAWALSLACNILFSFIINSLSFRRVNKIPLTDITKY